MTTFDYDLASEKALAIIARFGKQRVLRDKTPDSDNEGDIPCTVALLQYTPRERQSGGTIGYTDQKAVMAAKGLTVEPDDTRHVLVVGDKELRILSVKKIAPADTVVVWVLQVRE